MELVLKPTCSYQYQPTLNIRAENGCEKESHVTLPETNSLHLKIGFPKRKPANVSSFPSIVSANLLLVLGRVINSGTDLSCFILMFVLTFMSMLWIFCQPQENFANTTLSDKTYDKLMEKSGGKSS